MDVETIKEFAARWEAMEALWRVWLASAFDPAVRDLWFPVGTEPGDTWRGQTFIDEMDAIAHGYVAVWP